MTANFVKQIAHACIFSFDIDDTADWYHRVLGFDITFNFTRDGRVFGYYMAAGNRTFIEVFQKDSARFSENDQINHICFEVTEMDVALAHFKKLGIPALEKSKGCDETWQSWITDPNGTKIELFEYTDKSAQFVGGDRVAHW